MSLRMRADRGHAIMHRKHERQRRLRPHLNLASFLYSNFGFVFRNPLGALMFIFTTTQYRRNIKCLRAHLLQF